MLLCMYVIWVVVFSFTFDYFVLFFFPEDNISCLAYLLSISISSDIELSLACIKLLEIFRS